jgi:hypothetical protein
MAHRFHVKDGLSDTVHDQPKVTVLIKMTRQVALHRQSGVSGCILKALHQYLVECCATA